MARTIHWWLLVLLLTVIGCGGGGGDSDHPKGNGGGDAGTGGTSDGSGGTGGSGGTHGGGGTGGTQKPPARPDDPDNHLKDWDCDGLSDAEEFGTIWPGGRKTDPQNPDSDGDGIPDGVEAGRTQSPDPACEGIFVGDKDPSTTTDPTNPDTDGDGIPDGLEDANHNGRVDTGETDPNDIDSDGDGLPDGLEDRNHNGKVDKGETDPRKRDTDGDGIPDGIEDRNRNGVRDPGETDPTNPDTDGDGLVDGEEDLNWNGIVDPGESDPLDPTDPPQIDPNLDSDGDGIPDALEIRTGTNPYSADTDCDGIPDGEEDKNKNGKVDAGETDPRNPDTDGDGLLDGVEVGKTSSPDPSCHFSGDADPTTKTNPLNPDSDGDGIPDGAEDANRNGRVDAGETDPNNRNDATPTAVAACAVQNLAPITLHPEAAADLLLATRPTYTERSTIRSGGAAVGKMVFAPASQAQPVPMAGFALIKRPRGTTPIAEEAAARQAIGGLTAPIVQPFTTWDGYPAVRAIYDLSGNGDLKARANAVVQALVPGSTDLLTGTAGTNGPFKLQMEYVVRSPNRAVIVASVMKASDWTGENVWRLDDVANGSALGQHGDQINAACDRFTTGEWPKIDFLWVIDNSGSMEDDQTALANAATEMGNQLSGAAIDWRVAVVTTDYDRSGPGSKRRSDFTRSIPEFQDAAQPGIRGSGTERGFEPVRCVLGGDPSCGTASTRQGYFLPAADDRADRIRPDATLVVIFVQDEPEQSRETEDYWINYFADWDPHRPGAQSAFLAGILTCQLQHNANCNNTLYSERFHRVIQASGGVVGDLTDLSTIGQTVNAIVNVVIGSTARIHLSQPPVSASLKVAVDGRGLVDAEGPGCNPNDVARSRTHGFDYDGATNNVSFYGDCRTKTSERVPVAVSYRTWLDVTSNPDGDPVPCGGCEAPLVCNPARDRCECPADCGVGQIPAGSFCDRTACQVVCAPDCGGLCRGNSVCDTDACGCVCEQRQSCAPGFTFDSDSCGCVCDVGATSCGGNRQVDPNTCQCICPNDCGGCDTGFCDQSRCECIEFG